MFMNLGVLRLLFEIWQYQQCQVFGHEIVASMFFFLCFFSTSLSIQKQPLNNRICSISKQNGTSNGWFKYYSFGMLGATSWKVRRRYVLQILELVLTLPVFSLYRHLCRLSPRSLLRQQWLAENWQHMFGKRICFHGFKLENYVIQREPKLFLLFNSGCACHTLM